MTVNDAVSGKRVAVLVKRNVSRRSITIKSILGF